MATTVWLRLPLAVCALLTLAAIANGEAPVPAGQSSGSAPSLFEQVATHALGDIPTWKLELPRQLPPLLGDDGTQPDTLVYLRVSQEYLSRRFERNVNRTKPVVDHILGTSIRGKSLTRGTTRLVLVPNADHFEAEIEFVGTVASKTRGTNGPAILHYQSNSTFRATKRIMLDAGGIATAPARATAKTQLQPRSIQSRMGGLAGMIVERVARRRVAETRSQANAIASDHTAHIVAGDLDRGLEKSIGDLAAALAEAAGLKSTELAQLMTDGAGKQLHLMLRTTHDHAELVLAPQAVTWKELATDLPAHDDSTHVVLRVHRSVLTSLGTDSSGSPALARLFASGLKTQLAKRSAAIVELPAKSNDLPIDWSFDVNWLSVNVGRATPIDSTAFRSAQVEVAPPQSGD
ncbi:MAG: hypothetical protein AB7G28_07790 [Pirellulales bacterium]